jgi:hypothetical protein
MAPPPGGAYKAVDQRDAMVAHHLGVISARDAPAKYNIPLRSVSNALLELDGINAERIAANQASLIESSKRRQVFRWASNFTNAPIQAGHGCTHWELRELFIQNVTTDSVVKSQYAKKSAPQPMASIDFKKRALAVLNIKSMKLLKMDYLLKVVSFSLIGSATKSIEP